MSANGTHEIGVKVSELDNGLRVVTDTMPGLASATLGVWVGAGGRHESAPQTGVAHFLEHMAFKGTATRSAREIAEAIEDVGGDLNAYTSREITAYHARVLADDVPRGFDVVADILRNPTFDAADIELERGVILQEIGQSRDTPDDVVFDWAQECAFPDQPIGRPILGPEENVTRFQKADLAGFVAERYAPKTMVVAAAGAVDHDAVLRVAEAQFGDLEGRAASGAEPARYVGGDRIESKDLEQAHLVLGLPAPGYAHDAFFACQVYATLLGGGMSSRLFQEAREQRGLCYSIFAQPECYADGGLLTVYAGCGGEDVEDLLEIVADQIRDTALALDPAEVSRARAQIKAGMLMALESPSSRTERLGRNLLLHGRIRPVEEIIARLDAVNAETLREFAASLAQGPRPSLTLYGPISGRFNGADLQTRMTA